MAKNKSKSEKREKKKLAVDASDSPVSKKKKRITEVSEGSDTEKPQVESQDAIETADLTPEEQRVQERKLKKERKKLEKRIKKEKKSAGEITEEPAKPTAGELALQYLKSWSKKKPEWKFQKTRQTWLLMNIYDTEKVPKKYFKMLLNYIEDLKGSARETTIQKAEEYMKEHDNCETPEEADEEKQNRMREVLQILS
ncbi:protein cholesin [Rhinoderma darwinii]|uniref:protein cholesin n=1 Tax=Rhinoderma darwinii TaxID=43563 RepID=UPI003F67779D